MAIGRLPISAYCLVKRVTAKTQYPRCSCTESGREWKRRVYERRGERGRRVEWERQIEDSGRARRIEEARSHVMKSHGARFRNIRKIVLSRTISIFFFFFWRFLLLVSRSFIVLIRIKYLRFYSFEVLQFWFFWHVVRNI